MWESRRKGWELGKGVREPEVKAEGPWEKGIGTRREWSRNQERKRQEIGEKGRETTEKGVGPGEKRGREPGEKKVGPSLRVAVPSLALFSPREEGTAIRRLGPTNSLQHPLSSLLVPTPFSLLDQPPSLWFLSLSLLIPVGEKRDKWVGTRGKEDFHKNQERKGWDQEKRGELRRRG